MGLSVCLSVDILHVHVQRSFFHASTFLDAAHGQVGRSPRQLTVGEAEREIFSSQAQGDIGRPTRASGQAAAGG